MTRRTVRLFELLGQDVFTADGRRIGRVYDIVAEKQGDELAVTELLVGPSAWLERFGWTKSAHGRQIPWEAVASFEPRITLYPGVEQ